LDHVAQVNTDAKLNATFGRQASVALGHAVLDLDGAANSIHNTSKLNEDAIARPVDDAAVMQRDGGINEIASECAQPRKRPLLVGSSEFAVSGYIRRKNSCEFARLGHGCPSPHARLARLLISLERLMRLLTHGRLPPGGQGLLSAGQHTLRVAR